MKRNTLPAQTPALAAFAAGRTIQPVGYVAGRPVYPIAGGAPDDPPADPAPTDPPADDPPADPPPEPKQQEPKKGDVDYFPRDTPRADMTATERLAYDAFHGRKHEQRSKDWAVAAGVKTPEELATIVREHAELKQASLTDGERALSEAETKGRREASLGLAPQLFDMALRHVDEDRRKVLIDTIDMSRVLTDNGGIDTDKVSTIAETLAPADTGPGDRGHDYGAGPRRHQTASGVAAGRASYTSSRKK